MYICNGRCDDGLKIQGNYSYPVERCIRCRKAFKLSDNHYCSCCGCRLSKQQKNRNHIKGGNPKWINIKK